MHGKITQWFDGRGFGFVTRDDGQPKLFVHYSDCDRRPREGDPVEFSIGAGAKGPCAVDVRVIAAIDAFEGE